MKYKELRQYFKKNREALPQSVGGAFSFFPDVKRTVDAYITIIDAQLKRVPPEKWNSNRYLLSQVHQLRNVYNLIQDPEAHKIQGLKRRAFTNY